MKSIEQTRPEGSAPLHIREGATVSVDGLAAALRGYERGMTGEMPKGEPVIDVKTMRLYLEKQVVQWSSSTRLLDELEATYQKLISRHPTIVVDSVQLHEQLSHKINDLVAAAEFPQTETGYKGLRRLIESVDSRDAMYYLSDDFVCDLQDTTSSETMQQAIGQFFSIPEMLRRASVTRDVVNATQQSVMKAVEIDIDKASYFAQISGGSVSEAFAQQLTPSALLYFTTRHLNSIDEVLVEKAQLFDKLAAAYPLMASIGPEQLFSFIKTGGKSEQSIQRIHGRCQQLEAELEEGRGNGLDRDTLRLIGRGAGPEKAMLYTLRRETLRRGIDPRHQHTPGSVGAEAAALRDNEVVPLEAYGTLLEGSEYRTVIFETNRRCRPESLAEAHVIFERVASIKQTAAGWVEMLPQDEIGRRYAESLLRAYEKRVTEIVSLVPGLLNGETQTGLQIQEEDSRPVSVQSLTEVADALKALDYLVKNQYVAYQHEFSESTTSVGQSIGRFESLATPLAVSLRPESTEHGEARQAWRVTMSFDDQLAVFGRVIHDRVVAVTVRLDCEAATGQLSFDVGSNLDGPLNELLARVTTVGAQTIARYRSDHTSGADYHVREVFDTQLADPALFRRYVIAAMYGLEIHLPAVDDDRKAA